MFFVFKQKTAYEMRISDWSSDVCSSDLKLIIDGKRGQAILGEHDPVEAELSANITLVQGIPSGDKMDWIIEKAVELGAVRVVPITARRSVLQLSGERLRKRLEHWRRIAQAASEQRARKSVVEGKSVSVRVDPGGGGRRKKKT